MLALFHYTREGKRWDGFAAARVQVNPNGEAHAAGGGTRSEEIGRVIGPGGRVIKQIMDETQTTLYIDEGGNVSITGKTHEAVERAKQKVLAIVEGEGSEVPQKAYTLGEAYEAEVVRVLPSGAIVKLLDGTGTLAFVHISEVADFYIKDLSKVLRVGERVKVKLIAFDDQGRLRASIKQAG